jgi:hypothetical protein
VTFIASGIYVNAEMERKTSEHKVVKINEEVAYANVTH